MTKFAVGAITRLSVGIKWGVLNEAFKKQGKDESKRAAQVVSE